MGNIGKDPVCGMLVDSEKATDSIPYKGTTYHFCSTPCAEKFQMDPERYAGPTAGGGELKDPPAA